MAQSRPELLLITGIPRSGTTLVGSLVDRLEDSVCLSEPPELGFRGLMADCSTATTYVTALEAWLPLLRSQLRRGEQVVDRRYPDGRAATNWFSDDAPRGWNVQVAFRGLTERCLLAIKLNTPFTSVLPEIAAQTSLSMLYVVRHPVPTILSWRARPTLPIHRGVLPAARRFWPSLTERMAAAPTVLDAQAHAYAAFAERYLAHADRGTLVRYESLVREPSQIPLALDRALVDDPTLSDHNHNPLYDQGDVDAIVQALRRVGGATRELYPDLEHY